MFNGIPAQLKTQNTESVKVLVRALQDAEHQADLVFIDLIKENEDIERELERAKN